jgi:DNA invertase Pin-like site-specific DNA recombinase
VNCYSYLRVSGASQIDQDGPERQRLACQDFAIRNGYTITGEYFEAGVSGKSELANRPALSAMLAAMEENGVTVIIIEKLDRLARDLMVSETILADLRKSGYTLISTCEPDLCSNDPSRKLVRQIFSAIAEYDRAMIVMKLKGARERMKAKEGRCEGRKPFGLMPGEAATLALMRDRRRVPMTYQQIADRLNDCAIPTRGGGPWRMSTVAKILSR